MATIVGLASLTATSLDLGKHRETTAVEVVERKEYLLLIGLVVGDKYRFHVYIILNFEF
jgi:hypothetical protein